MLFPILQDKAYSQWTWFELNWSWIGLYIGLLFTAFLLFTNRFRSQLKVSRWRDPVWLAWLVVPLYQIHQFEEYGVDLTGQRNTFPNTMCNNLGLGEYPACPIPPIYFAAVNIGIVWVVAPLVALLCGKDNRLVLSSYSVVSSNALVHILGSVKVGYTPGLLSAIIFFVPITCWILYISRDLKEVGLKGVFMYFVIGIVFHVIMFSSLGFFAKGRLGKELLVPINLVNTTTTFVLNWLWQGLWKEAKTTKRE